MTRTARIPSEGLQPIARKDARILVLGTFPGAASLKHLQYYAHPRNAFWPIMGKLVGASPDLSYEQRTQKLVQSGIALWDVCKAVYRPGSLDTSIDPTTIVPNDFITFFRDYPRINLICFSSARAAQMYVSKVLQGHLPLEIKSIRREILHSPSPTRTLPFEQKLAQWSTILGPALTRSAA